MLREGWNFHGDIAVTLESVATHHFGDIGRPMSKIYDADAIETGCFVEVMIILLRERTNMENDRDDIDQFIGRCAPYLGMSGNTIPHEIAHDLFTEFQELYE